MDTTLEYETFGLILSAILMVVFLVHLRYAVWAYRKHHDERASIVLMLALMKVVVAVGLFVSALGLPLDSAELAKAGLSLVRGALLVSGITLLIADRSMVERDKER